MIHPNDTVQLLNMTGKLLWSDVNRWFWMDDAGSGLDRWNYYEDPAEPKPPPYTQYTGFTLQCTFALFFMLPLRLHGCDKICACGFRGIQGTWKPV